MDINDIKWMSFVSKPNYLEEVEFLEWHSDPDGRFLRSDISNIFNSLAFGYSKVIEECVGISFTEAYRLFSEKNCSNFRKTMDEVFESIPLMCGIGYSKLERILSVVVIPVFK